MDDLMFTQWYFAPVWISAAYQCGEQALDNFKEYQKRKIEENSLQKRYEGIQLKNFERGFGIKKDQNNVDEKIFNLINKIDDFRKTSNAKLLGTIFWTNATLVNLILTYHTLKDGFEKFSN